MDRFLDEPYKFDALQEYGGKAGIAVTPEGYIRLFPYEMYETASSRGEIEEYIGDEIAFFGSAEIGGALTVDLVGMWRSFEDPYDVFGNLLDRFASRVQEVEVMTSDRDILSGPIDEVMESYLEGYIPAPDGNIERLRLPEIKYDASDPKGMNVFLHYPIHPEDLYEYYVPEEPGEYEDYASEMENPTRPTREDLVISDPKNPAFYYGIAKFYPAVADMLAEAAAMNSPYIVITGVGEPVGYASGERDLGKIVRDYSRRVGIFPNLFLLDRDGGMNRLIYARKASRG